MLKPIDIADDFAQFCRELDFDANLNQYKETLFDCQQLNNAIVFCNQFFYINDFEKANNVFVHPNIELITGYPPGEFMEFHRIYELIHPDDREFVYEFAKRTITLCKHYKQELQANTFQSLFSIDFRLKHLEGHYIKLNRQTTCLKTDKEGNMVFALVHFTDITDTKKGNSYCISRVGDSKHLFYFEDLVKKYCRQPFFTLREKEVLASLSTGINAREIAEKLCISINTVISHRKNLLKKTKTKNTPELIYFATEYGLF